MSPRRPPPQLPRPRTVLARRRADTSSWRPPSAPTSRHSPRTPGAIRKARGGPIVRVAECGGEMSSTLCVGLARIDMADPRGRIDGLIASPGSGATKTTVRTHAGGTTHRGCRRRRSCGPRRGDDSYDVAAAMISTPWTGVVAHGHRGGISTTSIPASAMTASNEAVNCRARSRTRNRNRAVCSPRSIRRLRACWVSAGELEHLGGYVPTRSC